MQLAPSTRLGPFEIVAPLGAGGMGEVYRARDTRLDRQVAIKILSRDLASSASLRERFDREARAVSQLAHPHICTLFDVGHDNGTDYLVMEYLEGETLAEKIRRGALTLDEVLEYGIQIADALDKAHRQGIVHRDLKPGNIMLTRAGAKLLDFGLAKLSLRSEPLGGLTSLPTEQKSLTQEGTILGTFQYMAPEQLEGAEADARTDIFAFGAVLYEMATARKAFDGKTKTSIIAAIVDRDPPPISAVQPLTPPALEHLIRKCLEKDPERRWQSAADIATQLRWISEGGSQAGLAAPIVVRRKNRERAAWALALLALAAAATLGTLWWRASTTPRPRVELALTPPPDAEFVFGGAGENIALSPDGTKIVFSAKTQSETRLWIRLLRTSVAHPLAGTENARAPFFSPDGRYVAFFANGKLKKIDTAGGPAQTICDANGSGGHRGGSWNHENIIVFTPNARSPLYKISANGGTPVEVTKLDASRGEYSHRFPSFLPDGDHFIYLSRTGAGGGEIRVASLSGGPSKILVPVESPPFFAAPGYLLFVREGTLVAQRFDPKSHEVSPDTIPVAENIRYFPSATQAIVATSAAGVVAYHIGGGGSESELAWVDRSGKSIEPIGAPRDYRAMSLSDDGSRLAVTIQDPQSGNDDIWIYDLARGIPTRLTFESVMEDWPVWTRDGSEVIFSAERPTRAVRDIVSKKSSGEGTATVLLESQAVKWPTDVSEDGAWIAFNSVDLIASKGGHDVMVFSRRDGKVIPVAATEFDERGGRFSPDGKWIAYASTESGQPEVYVQRWPPAGGGKWQVSIGGGALPHWRGDGKEIFYRSIDANAMMAVSVTAGATFQSGQPQKLFELSVRGPAAWDVTRDGQRFIVNRLTREEKPNPVTVIVNWAEGLGE